jgi:DNA-binding CsgD family transcriptional regulator
MTLTAPDVLIHYGILRRSGRYPWGSGATSEERSRSFLGAVDDLRAKGLSEVEIAKGLGITNAKGNPSVSSLRALRSIARDEARKGNVAQALRLQDKGMSNVAIGNRMGLNESTVRTLLDPATAEKKDVLQNVAKTLEDRIKDGGYLDVGPGTANHLDISATQLSTAIAVLREKGYETRNIQVPQLGTGQKTTIKTLVPAGAPKFIDPTQIKSIAAYSEDGGRTIAKIEPPKNISSSRVGVRYKENGGDQADGVIYVRPGVDEVSLGKSRYAQVRIAVDGTHYLKGMAMYKDDLPAGHDLVFNTNKSNTGNKLDAFKAQKDEENPFGATVRQRKYTGKDGKTHLSVMNIVNEEGDWRDWSRSLSSQFLSKQPVALAKRQLDMSFTLRREQLDEIMKLTNPVVKKKLLESFADSADSASVHLKAAALPKQGTHVILPISSLKETEVYAPNYDNGERVALVRFPHGGKFEIPEVTVNNRNREAKAALPNAPDAIGIHPNVAKRLSGADFDGDTVLVIPNNRGEVKTAPPLSKLKDFDPQTHYAPYDGMKTIDGGTYHAASHSVDYGGGKPNGRPKQHQMGDVSNLITDMTIKGANDNEIAAAVRHSMVVIDAEKHHLDYKQSYRDNGIAALKERYQGRGATGRLAGASTIVSRAGSEQRVAARKLRRASEGGPVNPKTGERVYVPTGQIQTINGKTVIKTVRSTKLAEVRDARKLSSGQPIENVYADHSNSLKALANDARRQSLHAGRLDYSPSAAKTYKAEVSKLTSELNIALKNKPKERQAQLIANAMVKATRADNPHMDTADLKKLKSRALDTARARVGAERHIIDISPEQWRAIQEGAITSHRLRSILDHADPDKVKKLATPRTATVVTPAKLAIIKNKLANGYSQAEIARDLGIPVSTINTAIHRKEG